MSLHRKFLMFVNSIPLALFIYLLCIFLFGIVLVFLLPILLQLATQCNTTFVPVSCYFHINSGVFYSQAYTFNTEEFKLHCVFLEAAQCKSFHLRRSNKLENCSEKKWKGGRMQFSEGKSRNLYLGRKNWLYTLTQEANSYEKDLGTVDHQHDINSVLRGKQYSSLGWPRYWNDPSAFLSVS